MRITLDAFRGRAFPGTITYVASFVETRQEQNRTLTVEADFDGAGAPRRTCLPGLSADLEILLDAREKRSAHPHVFAFSRANRVLVVDGEPPGRALGHRGHPELAVHAGQTGLAEGDRVVVSLDRPEVKAGARVRIADETAR